MKQHVVMKRLRGAVPRATPEPHLVLPKGTTKKQANEFVMGLTVKARKYWYWLGSVNVATTEEVKG